jgi:DNA-binding MarR family transcriptional regulator
MITLDAMTGTRQGPLAERLHVEPMTLVGHLDRLEGRGLVSRRPDPCDRRAKLVEPTERGRATTEEIRAVSAEVRASLVVGLADDEVTRLRRLLQRIRNNLAGDAAKAVRP